LGLTLSGGASLGAFEAGAAAALVLAVRHLDGQEGQEASIDAIGGASAGALVALASAHALLEGVDPVELLHETWVEGVTLSMLRSGDSRALLSFDALREGLPDVLTSVAEEARACRAAAAPDRAPRPADRAPWADLPDPGAATRFARDGHLLRGLGPV